MPRSVPSASLLAALFLALAPAAPASAQSASTQPADQGLVVCGGQKTKPGEKKNGEISFYDKRTNTIAKAVQAAGYGQRKYIDLPHWTDIAHMLKHMPEKYVAFYDRNVKEQGPNLAFGDLGTRGKLAEVAKFCVLAKPIKVCEDFTAC